METGAARVGAGSLETGWLRAPAVMTAIAAKHCCHSAGGEGAMARGLRKNDLANLG